MRLTVPPQSFRDSYVWRGGSLVPCTAPHDILDKPVDDYLPGVRAGAQGDPAAQALVRLRSQADEVLATVRPGTSVWFWGEGTAPSADMGLS